MLPSGTRLGPYTIVDLVGSGGMGEVYRARDDRLGRDVAIKVLPAHLAGDTSSLDRFRREARAVASLSHPNIVSIFDFGREGAIDYAVSELLDGETLRTRMARGPMQPREALAILLEIADGVAAAHARGIIHRDLKPENVIITTSGRVKVLDFGLARASGIFGAPDGRTDIMPTEPGVVIGTIGYLAPEQVEGRQLTPATDVFALGCMLFEMIAGRLPFVGETAAHSMVVLLHDPSPELDDAQVDAILQHCLEKSPHDRYANAGELAAAIRTVMPRVSHETTVRVRMRRPRRSPARLALAAIGLIALIVAIAAYRAIAGNELIDHGYDLRMSDIRADSVGRRLLALALRADAEGNRPKAMELLEEAHRRSTDTAFPAAFLSSFLDAAGAEQASREWARSATARLGGASPYESLLVRYLVHSSDGDPARELALANSILDIRPEAWRLRLAAAHLHLNRRDGEAALRELKRIDVTKPDDRRLMLVLADRASLGDVGGASAALARSRLTRHPSFLHYTEARIAWSRGDLAGAQKRYDAVADEFAAENLAGLEIECRMLSGLALMRLGDSTAAQPRLANAAARARQLRLPSREFETHAMLAWVSAHLGDADERDRNLAEARRAGSDPDDEAILTLLALRLGSPLARSWPAADLNGPTLIGVEPLIRARLALTDGSVDEARRLLRQARSQGVETTNFREEAELLAAETGMPSRLLRADPPYPMSLRLLAIFDLERLRPR